MAMLWCITHVNNTFSTMNAELSVEDKFYCLLSTYMTPNCCGFIYAAPSAITIAMWVNVYLIRPGGRALLALVQLVCVSFGILQGYHNPR